MMYALIIAACVYVLARIANIAEATRDEKTRQKEELERNRRVRSLYGEDLDK